MDSRISLNQRFGLTSRSEIGTEVASATPKGSLYMGLIGRHACLFALKQCWHRKFLSTGTQAYINNHVAAMEENFSLVWKMVVQDISSLPWRLIKMGCKYTWLRLHFLLHILFLHIVDRSFAIANPTSMVNDFGHWRAGATHPLVGQTYSFASPDTYTSFNHSSISG